MNSQTELTIRYRSAEPGVMHLHANGSFVGIGACYSTGERDAVYRQVIHGDITADRLTLHGSGCTPELLAHSTRQRRSACFTPRRIIRSGHVSLESTTSAGVLSLRWRSGARLTDWYATVRTPDSLILSTDYPEAHTHRERFRDAHGTGWLCTVTRSHPDLPHMVQRIWLYDKAPWVAVQVSLICEGSAVACCDVMSPITCVRPDSVHLSSGSSTQALWVPFKNDTWDERAQLRAVDTGSTSYQLGALLGSGTCPDALIIGDADNRTWKTGITTGGRDGKLHVVSAYGGAASPTGTGDYASPPRLTGQSVDSPRIWLGWFNDWREGLESYGELSGRVYSPIRWPHAAPVGWSSWGAYHTTMRYQDAVAGAEYMQTVLRPAGFHAADGAQNIHLDAWSTLVEERIGEFRTRITRNNQTLGAYACPLAYWGDDMDARVWGIPGTYRWGEVVQRLDDGRIHPKLNGGYYPVDPTHPAIRESIQLQFSRFRQWGVRFVKLDFMLGGCCEGPHYLKHIRTGFEAFLHGLQIILDESVYPDGSTMFLQMEIAPLFPAGYTHSHLITSDIHHTGAFLNHFVLSAATWQWWRAGRINQYNDAGIFTFEQNDGVPLHSEALARSRVTAMIVAGSPLIVCIDPRRTDQTAAAQAVLTNAAVNRLGNQARPFRPTHPGDGTRPCDLFTRCDADSSWVAVFNLTNNATIRRIDLQAIGIDWRRAARIREIWSQTDVPVARDLICPLEPDGCALYQIPRKHPQKNPCIY